MATFPITVETIEIGSMPKPGSDIVSFRRGTRHVPSLGPREVLVRILCTGVCHTDFMMFHRPDPIGSIPGHEAIGIVEAVGSNAVMEKFGIDVGDRVGIGYGTGSCGSCRECDERYESNCDRFTSFFEAPHGLGAYASRVTRDAGFVFLIPDGLPSPYAGPLLCAGATVYSALADSGIPNGGTVGVVGIGGLGHLAIMFGVAMGYKVVALSRTPGKEELAKELGASSVIITSDMQSMKDARRTIDLLLSTVPANVDWEEYLELVVPRGRAHIVGVAPKPHIIPSLPILTANRSFGGSLIAGSDHMKDMLQLAAEKKVWPKIECYPMTPEGTEEAVKSVAENKVRFRAVLVRDGCDGVPDPTMNLGRMTISQ